MLRQRFSFLSHMVHDKHIPELFHCRRRVTGENRLRSCVLHHVAALRRHVGEPYLIDFRAIAEGRLFVIRRKPCDVAQNDRPVRCRAGFTWLSQDCGVRVDLSTLRLEIGDLNSQTSIPQAWTSRWTLSLKSRTKNGCWQNGRRMVLTNEQPDPAFGSSWNITRLWMPSASCCQDSCRSSISRHSKCHQVREHYSVSRILQLTVKIGCVFCLQTDSRYFSLTQPACGERYTSGRKQLRLSHTRTFLLNTQ